ncbi:hypothetical protein GGQ74_002189 [Desulfobaculum xiamenense]|uniref:Uncharacterized protein n=1 Tax=Desulfobaculum xiamenense TaxID=995050 RepID=A0A846QI41_9BACT|nr:hypothetical protein [Desulfobaculum xiamenense]NJB68516.1 hypothetical protein [Desulfobaculum xiamenense]
MAGVDVEALDFVPVPVAGMQLCFEMCATGLVRRCGGAHRTGALPWLLPHARSDADATVVFRLCVGGRTEVLELGRVFEAFGLARVPPPGWLDRARATVRELNVRHREEELGMERRHRVEREIEAEEGGELPEYMMQGCPWERGMVGGDAAGADPVIGF